MWLDTRTARGPGRVVLGSEPAGLRLHKKARYRSYALLVERAKVASSAGDFVFVGVVDER